MPCPSRAGALTGVESASCTRRARHSLAVILFRLARCRLAITALHIIYDMKVVMFLMLALKSSICLTISCTVNMLNRNLQVHKAEQYIFVSYVCK